MPLAALVRKTRRCGPARRPSEKKTSRPQFSWIAPPASNPQAVTSTFSAPLAPVRKRDSAAISNGGNAVAAIDRNDRAGYIGTGGRGQKQQRAVEIFGLRDPLQRNPRDQPLASLGLEEFAVEIGLDITRRQGIDEDPVARQLHRQHMRQMDEAGLRGAIGRYLADRPEPQYRGDVDDAARPFALDQMVGEFARRQPRAFQVRVDDMIPIRFAVLEQRFRHDDAG